MVRDQGYEGGGGGGVDDGAQEGKGVWAEFSCLHLQKYDDAS